MPGEPRVTVNDVKAYLTGDYFRAAGVDEIASIEFLPANEAEERIDVAPGSYGGRILCMVDLRGSFTVRVPPEVQEKISEDGGTPYVSRMILIFDALTGNLLSEAAPPP